MKEFITGHTYFLLSFLDKDFKFPIIVSIVYLGMNLEKEIDQNEHDLWFFQDAESYIKIGPYTGSTKEAATAPVGSVTPVAQVYDFPENQLKDILTGNELIKEIQVWITEP